MALDRLAIMRADVDVDPDHRSLPDQFKQRGHEQNGAAARNAGLDDDIGLGRPNDLLRRHHIRRKLDDRNTHPAPEVEVVIFVGGMNRAGREIEHLLIAAKRERLHTLLLLKRGAVIRNDHDIDPAVACTDANRSVTRPSNAAKRRAAANRPGSSQWQAGPSQTPSKCRSACRSTMAQAAFPMRLTRWSIRLSATSKSSSRTMHRATRRPASADATPATILAYSIFGSPAPCLRSIISCSCSPRRARHISCGLPTMTCARWISSRRCSPHSKQIAVPPSPSEIPSTCSAT